MCDRLALHICLLCVMLSLLLLRGLCGVCGVRGVCVVHLCECVCVCLCGGGVCIHIICRSGHTNIPHMHSSHTAVVPFFVGSKTFIFSSPFPPSSYVWCRSHREPWLVVVSFVADTNVVLCLAPSVSSRTHVCMWCVSSLCDGG